MKSANYNDYNDMRYYTTLLLKMYNDKEKMRHLIQWKTMHATFITMNPNIVLISHSIVHCNDVVYNDSWIRNNAIHFIVCMLKLMKYQTVDIVVCMPKLMKYRATTILFMETYRIDSVLHGRPECRFH